MTKWIIEKCNKKNPAANKPFIVRKDIFYIFQVMEGSTGTLWRAKLLLCNSSASTSLGNCLLWSFQKHLYSFASRTQKRVGRSHQAAVSEFRAHSSIKQNVVFISLSLLSADHCTGSWNAPCILSAVAPSIRGQFNLSIWWLPYAVEWRYSAFFYHAWLNHTFLQCMHLPCICLYDASAFTTQESINKVSEINIYIFKTIPFQA